MTVNAQAVIQALVKAGEDKGPGVKEIRYPVVTISRGMGTGGDEVGRLLAERLGVEYYGHEVLDAVAKHAKVQGSLMNKLHEQVSKSSDAWLYAMVFGKNVTRTDYQHALVTTVRGMYRTGGVIVGRGGHLILAGRDVLRVRIVGSPEACAKRVALEDDIDETLARKMVTESNRKRGKFLWDVFRSRGNDPVNFDLVINTDHLADYDHAVELIMTALTLRGLDQPREVAAPA